MRSISHALRMQGSVTTMNVSNRADRGTYFRQLFLRICGEGRHTIRYPSSRRNVGRRGLASV